MKMLIRLVNWDTVKSKYEILNMIEILRNWFRFNNKSKLAEIEELYQKTITNKDEDFDYTFIMDSIVNLIVKFGDNQLKQEFEDQISRHFNANSNNDYGTEYSQA